MTPKVKYGLIVGGIGLILNICISGFIGFCGPVVALAAGAGAGFLTAREEKAPTQGENARLGAISGTIAGVLILMGQLIGGIGVLLYIQATGASILFGEISPAQSGAEQMGFWLGGIGVGVCLGLVDVIFGALAGAGGGYLNGPSKPRDTESLPLN